MQIRARFARIVSVLVLSGPAFAQVDFDFAVDQPASDFTWSGDTNYGPVVGNPSNAFEFQGHFSIELSPSGSNPLASGVFQPVGDLYVVPDLHGRIPGPFGTTFATIDCVDVHMVMSSPSFAITGNGAFSTPLTMTIIQGTMFITPAFGAPSQLDLTGYQSDPDVQAGSVTQNGDDLHMVLPITAAFAFNITGGASGTIDITGALVSDWICPAPQTYCTAKTNSLGCVPTIGTSGSPSYTNSAPFTVSATNELNLKNGLLYYGFAPLAAPFQGGIKCVASPTVRTTVQFSGGSPSGNDCTGVYSFDFNAWIQTYADPSLVPGEEVFCQYWSRDPASFGNTNLTDAARFSVCP